MKTLRDKIVKLDSEDNTQYIFIPFDSRTLNPFQISFICYIWEKRECFINKSKKRRIWKSDIDNKYDTDIEDLIRLGYIKIVETTNYGLNKYALDKQFPGYTIHKFRQDYWTILKRKV